MRFKYALPLAQMVLAVGLLWWSYRWDRWAMRIMDMPGPAPAFTLLVFINAPVALARMFWFHHGLEGLWSDALFVGLIGLLWYWIALNIVSWRARRTLVLFTWTPLRIAVDLVLIGVCACFLWYSRTVNVAGLPWRWFAPLVIFLIFWSFASVFILCRDLVLCFRHKVSRTASRRAEFK